MKGIIRLVVSLLKWILMLLSDGQVPHGIAGDPRILRDILEPREPDYPSEYRVLRGGDSGAVALQSGQDGTYTKGKASAAHARTKTTHD